MSAAVGRLAIVAVLGALWLGSPAVAAEKAPAPQATPGGAHESSPYYRRQAKPPARKGGYSYRPADTINTYGNSRTNYGSTNVFRFWDTDKQTISGPFDSGFFFDSAIGPRGGDAPYMN